MMSPSTIAVRDIPKPRWSVPSLSFVSSSLSSIAHQISMLRWVCQQLRNSPTDYFTNVLCKLIWDHISIHMVEVTPILELAAPQHMLPTEAVSCSGMLW